MSESLSRSNGVRLLTRKSFAPVAGSSWPALHANDNTSHPRRFHSAPAGGEPPFTSFEFEFMSALAQPQRQAAVPPPTRRLLSRVEAAGYAGVSPNFFDTMVGDGRMPRPRVANTRKLWDVRHLDAAIDALPIDGDGSPTSTWDDL